jgi:hypothetical protein
MSDLKYAWHHDTFNEGDPVALMQCHGCGALAVGVAVDDGKAVTIEACEGWSIIDGVALCPSCEAYP